MFAVWSWSINFARLLIALPLAVVPEPEFETKVNAVSEVTEATVLILPFWSSIWSPSFNSFTN